MAKGFKHGAGGTSLNFKVVGNPQPQNPKENTIWVDSDRINHYYFSATQPENMAEYDVWFYVGISSHVAFSATKKNPVMVYPISAKQYVSGAWVDKTAKSYQGGVWVDWWDGSTIYKNGNQYEFITGGWKSIGLKWGSQTVSGSIEYGEYLTVKAAGGGVYDATTAKKIDLTAYSQLLYDIASDSSTDDRIVIIHNIAPGGTLVSGGTVYCAAASNNGVINLTGLNGEYYISVVPTNNRTFKIGNIRLVK